MIAALTLILVCQLAGELAVAALGLPLPGPVVGMALMLAGLVFYGSVPADLGRVADGLLEHLALLFVPAGVGVMLHAALFAREGLALGVALVISTLASIVVTGLLMIRLTAAWASPAQIGDDAGS